MKINDFMKEISDNNAEYATTKETGMHKSPVIITILPFLSMLAVFIPSILFQTMGINTVKAGIITLILTSALSFYIRVNAEEILDKKLAKTVISLSYLASIGLLLFIPASGIFSFWMLGGLLVSMLIDRKLGLLLNFNLSFLMGIMVTKSPDMVLQVLIMSVIMCMLSGALAKGTTVIYASIIVLSLDLTLSFLMNNLIFDKQANYNYFFSMVSILAVILIAFLVNLLYRKSGKARMDKTSNLSEDSSTHSDLEDIQNIAAATDLDLSKEVEAADLIQDQTRGEDLMTTTQEASVQTKFVSEGWTSYEVLCDYNNELLRSMKEHSESLYEHSIMIGELSCRAAKEIGANDKLALAGGLYHEIGKLKGKNYIDEGLSLAEEYSFPKELKAIIKEHNIKSERPGSVEAAIVMLSDSVVATIDYIKKNDDRRFTTNKIIENIFQLRMEKGSFDSSTLSLRDYKRLKDFYQEEFANKE